MRCGPHLSCVQDGSIARCKSLWTSDPEELEDKCSADEVALSARQTRDPISDEAYYSCWSDVALLDHSQASIQLAQDDRGQMYLYRIDLKKVTLREAIERCAQFNDPISSSHLAMNLNDDEQLREDLINELNARLTPAQLALSGVWVAPSDYEIDTQVDDSLSGCQRLDLNTHQLEPTTCELELPTLCRLSISSFSVGLL
jgi:hypothetical protein